MLRGIVQTGRFLYTGVGEWGEVNSKRKKGVVSGRATSVRWWESERSYNAYSFTCIRLLEDGMGSEVIDYFIDGAGQKITN